MGHMRQEEVHLVSQRTHKGLKRLIRESVMNPLNPQGMGSKGAKGAE